MFFIPKLYIKLELIFCATLAVTRAKREETKTREGKVKEETIPSKHNGKQSYHISSNKSLSQTQNNSNNESQQQRTSNTKDTNLGSPPEENSIAGNRRDCELSGTNRYIEIYFTQAVC